MLLILTANPLPELLQCDFTDLCTPQTENVSCSVIQVAYRGKKENSINKSALLQEMESRMNKAATYKNVLSPSCLSQSTTSSTGTWLPAKPTRCRKINVFWAKSGNCGTEAGDSMVRLVSWDVEVTRKNSLSKLGAGTYGDVNASPESRYPPISANGVDSHGSIYSRLNSWLLGNGWVIHAGREFLIKYSRLATWNKIAQVRDLIIYQWGIGRLRFYIRLA